MLGRLRDRDARIRRWRDDDEVVLWFEHDLFDQLQLLQILDYFYDEPDATGRVSLIQANDYLGPMMPEQLAALYPTRQLSCRTSSSLHRTRGPRFGHRILPRFRASLFEPNCHTSPRHFGGISKSSPRDRTDWAGRSVRSWRFWRRRRAV